MYWIAENSNKEILVLTEREALIQFEQNNIAQRMRLRWIGTTSGQGTIEAKKKVRELIDKNRPADYPSLSAEDKNVTDQTIRDNHQTEISKIMDEGWKKDLEEAKQNGVKQPRKELHIHTKSDGNFKRDQILSSAGNMIG